MCTWKAFNQTYTIYELAFQCMNPPLVWWSPKHSHALISVNLIEIG